VASDAPIRGREKLDLDLEPRAGIQVAGAG
jgi:hypothetical protein